MPSVIANKFLIRCVISRVRITCSSSGGIKFLFGAQHAKCESVARGNPVITALRVSSQDGCVLIEDDPAGTKISRCGRPGELGERACKVMPAKNSGRWILLQKAQAS